MTRLAIEHITKSFPGVKALRDVSFTIEQGEVHALCGENGAGKSTLMNILSGNLKPEKGQITLNGKRVVFENPLQAFSSGVAIVYQHLSLIHGLTIAENIFANQHPTNRWGLINYDELHRRTETLLTQLDIALKPETRVSLLSASEKQLVEIAKALAKRPQILILDEPTASLNEKESRNLYQIIQRLKNDGVSIIYISHRLAEVELLADRISVLKDGVHQGTYRRNDLTREDLIKKMVGRDLIDTEKVHSTTSDIILNVENLSGRGLHQISFALHKGEILGLAGLAGAGRSAIARAVFGIQQKKGTVHVNGSPVSISNPREAIQNGIAFLPEDRKNLGLFEGLSIKDNIVTAFLERRGTSLLYDDGLARQDAEQFCTTLHIATPDINQRVRNLSGGNQQKVMLARWLLTQPEILIVDEPTHGIDVGARQEIYEILNSLAEAGKGIILISSELPELLALCNRVLVIKAGTIAGELKGEQVTEEEIIKLAT